MTRLKRVRRLERRANYDVEDLSKWSDDQLVERMMKLADQIDAAEWPPELAAIVDDLRCTRDLSPNP